MGIARATIVGNLTNDPRGNDTGTVCNLRVAVNTRRKVNDEWTDVAGYYDVVVLGGNAKNCMEYLKKGRQVAIDAKIQWREWQDKDGNNRQSVEFLADEIQFLGSGDRDDSPRSTATEPDASSEDLF